MQHRLQYIMIVIDLHDIDTCLMRDMSGSRPYGLKWVNVILRRVVSCDL